MTAPGRIMSEEEFEFALLDAGSVVATAVRDKLRAHDYAQRALLREFEEFVAKAFAEHRYCEDGYYGCPENPESFGHEGQRCDCRKPKADALLAALREARAREE